MISNAKTLLCGLLLLLAQSVHAQQKQVTVSGLVKETQRQSVLPFVNVTVLSAKDSAFVTGTISREDGLFRLPPLAPGAYLFRLTYVGHEQVFMPLAVGRLSAFLDLGTLWMKEAVTTLAEISVEAEKDAVESGLDRKVYGLDGNLSQLGGSVLQAMQNLPGVTVDREGNIFLRGSDKLIVLLDGKQTAFTGTGGQAGLENLPASAIERVEIINNPSAKYDASGMAGIINIVFKKDKREGWNGRLGLTTGLGGFGEKEGNKPGIREQYRFTPKINPSGALNYRRNDLNLFLNGDMLWHRQMMKNEHIERVYDNGGRVLQQYLENRTQPVYNLRAGADWTANERNAFTFSGLFNYREYTDLGDLPYFDGDLEDRRRLWQYYENEVNQTLFASLTHRHGFRQPGHQLVSSFNYSFRRKDEVFNFNDQRPALTGDDATALVADEHIFDLTADYARPLKAGRIELGTRQRSRVFPNVITFSPGNNSVLDPRLAGTAEYREWLSALYGNYIYEKKGFELEAGLRLEYVQVEYLVDPSHAVYRSEGFSYAEPFPSVRATFHTGGQGSLSLFYNRRVDRPEEKNLRAFPTYADPEILSMGNPGLLPQFTHTLEAGYKHTWQTGYFYSAFYHRASANVLTRIITPVPGSDRLVAVDQNADRGQNTGLEAVWSQKAGRFKIDVNANLYHNHIGAFTIVNAYPSGSRFAQEAQEAITGNVKLVVAYRLPGGVDLQLSGTYLAADVVAQGTIAARYHADAGISLKTQGGKGELFANASDIFNTLVVRYNLQGTGFNLRSSDFYETQVFRIGYQYRFGQQ